MKITEAEVERIAHFAQLEVTPEEIGKLAQQLSDILALPASSRRWTQRVSRPLYRF